MIEKIKIAVIGNGALSSIFIDQYYNHLTDNYELLGIMGRNEEKVKNDITSVAKYSCNCV